MRVWLAIAVFSMSQLPGPAAPRPVDDPDAVAVYARVLAGEWTVTVAHASRLAIDEDSKTFPGKCDLAGPARDGDWRSVFDDYAKENASSRKTPAHMAIGLPYVLDPVHTRAMVYVGHHCGGLCGGGRHYYLQKIDGAWQPAKVAVSSCSWES